MTDEAFLVYMRKHARASSRPLFAKEHVVRLEALCGHRIGARSVRPCAGAFDAPEFFEVQAAIVLHVVDAFRG